jgi:hypothetical protein
LVNESFGKEYFKGVLEDEYGIYDDQMASEEGTPWRELIASKYQKEMVITKSALLVKIKDMRTISGEKDKYIKTLRKEHKKELKALEDKTI